jgi:hypothetical protein
MYSQNFHNLLKQFFSTSNVRERNYITVKHELQYIVYNLVTFKLIAYKLSIFILDV